MNLNKLHDAIGLLDDDLVESVDALRSRSKRAAWKQWAAAAACLCVLIAGLLTWKRWAPVGPDSAGGPGNGETDELDGAALTTELITAGQIVTPEDNADGSVFEPDSYAFSAQYIRTDGYHEGVEYPRVTVIRSRQELESYYEANKTLYNLERREEVYSDTSIGFLDACDRYDDAYFAEQDLILILLEEGSGSVRHQVTDVHRNQNWQITVKRQVPELGTCDMAQWHIFVEIQMGKVISESEEADIQIRFQK